MLAWETDDMSELDGERLFLRPPIRADLNALDGAIQETLDELVRWLPWARPGHCRADSRQYLRHARAARAQRAAFEFVLSRRQTGELLGMASLHRIDWQRQCAGLGYWVRRSVWRKGVAADAGALLVEHAFRELRLHRLEAFVATENLASQRVVQKLGFTREGIARELELVNGRYLDHVQYSLLRSDVLGPGA